MIEYSLNLGSNPEFTGSVLVAYARAAYRLAKSGAAGAHTVLDVAPALLSPKSGEIRYLMPLLYMLPVMLGAALLPARGKEATLP